MLKRVYSKNITASSLHPVVAVWSSVEDMAGAPVEDVTGDLVVVVAVRMIMMTTMTMMTIDLNCFWVSL